MPEKNTKETTSEMYCNCANCQYPGMNRGMMGRFFVIRILLGLVIILMVFWLGVKIGEFKEFFNSYNGTDYHHDYMMPNQYYFNARMMPASGTSINTDTSTGSGPVTSPNTKK